MQLYTDRGDTARRNHRADDRLKDKLHQRYRITAGEDAMLIEGCYDNAYQDNSVQLKLKVPRESLGKLYDYTAYTEQSLQH